MDILVELLPKVLCTLIDDYRIKCNDCNIYLTNEYICSVCYITRCKYCDFINANSQACIECQITDRWMFYNLTVLSCIKCDQFAQYGITENKVEFCYSHAPGDIDIYAYTNYCHHKNCIGIGIFIDGNDVYCTKHTKTSIRYTIKKNDED